MAKGRRFNPSLDKDGTWFPHIGIMQKTPESITTTMLKVPQSPRLCQEVVRKLPSIYKAREKQADSKSFPFSVHDNRHCFENTGYYFDCGLGRKKTSPDKRQHLSRNFNLWACDFMPSCLDGFSNNQISYMYKKTVPICDFRRFPRCYSEKWKAFQLVPEEQYSEILQKKPEVKTDTKTEHPQEP